MEGARTYRYGPRALGTSLERQFIARSSESDIVNDRAMDAIAPEGYYRIQGDLGYPFEIKLPAYPVWKRGSIASEPDR